MSLEKPSGHSGNRKQRSKLDGQRIRNDIKRLQIEGNPSYEICKILDISPSAYWYYCSQLGKEAKKQLQYIRTKGLAHEYLIAKSRLLHIIESMEKIITDDKTPAKDKIEATRLSREVSLNILQLMVEGPKLEEIANSETESKDDFPVDEWVLFAEREFAKKFPRTNSDTT